MEIVMRHLGLVAGFLLLPGAAMAGGSDFCLTGAIGASEQSISCASRWVAADGTQFGPIADPQNTPHTPYNTPAQVWSSSSSSQYGTQAAPVWQGTVQATPVQNYPTPQPYATQYGNGAAAYSSGYVSGTPTIVQNVPQAGYGQVLVTRGAHSDTIYTSDSNWGASYPPVPTYVAPLPYSGPGAAPAISSYHSEYAAPTYSSSSYVSGATQSAYTSSYGAQSGCYSYGAQQAQPTICQATMPTYYAPQPAPVTVIQAAPVYSPPIAAVQTNGFYNGLNGGVGYNAPVYYGGGGGGGSFVTGDSTSVFSRAPLLRMRTHNTGNHGGGGHMGGGCNSGCGGGHMGGGHMGGGGGD